MDTNSRHRILRWWVASIVPALLVAVGCGSLRSEANAETEGRLQSLEAACGTESFTAASVLERLEASYEAPLFFEITGELSTLQLDIDYRDGRLRCLPGGEDRAARIEIGVDLGVRSENGALRESIPGVLSGYSDSDQFRIAGGIPYAEREGSYAGRRADEANGELFVEGWVDAAASMSQGAVRVLQNDRNGEAEHRSIATWDEGRHALRNSEAPCGSHPQLTRRRYLEALQRTGASPTRLSGLTGDSSLRLEVSYADQSVLCTPGTSEGRPATVASEARVELSTASGQLLETLMGHARMKPDGSWSFEATGPPLAAAEFAYGRERLERDRRYRPKIVGAVDADTGTFRGTFLGLPANSKAAEAARLASWEASARLDASE